MSLFQALFVKKYQKDFKYVLCITENVGYDNISKTNEINKNLLELIVVKITEN